MLSDRTRLHLLWLLTQGEADVTALAEATGGSRTSISQHLAKLRFARMVETRKEGRRVYYRLRDGHLSRLVQEGLNHADHRVTGEPSHP
jgi:DNA-binding transcriptional ArsR family regulator